MAGVNGFVTIRWDPIRSILSASLAAANSLEWSEGFFVPISHPEATLSKVPGNKGMKFSAILRMV